MSCDPFVYAFIYEALKEIYENKLSDKKNLQRFKKFNISHKDVFYLVQLCGCHHWFVILSMFSELLSNTNFWSVYNIINQYCMEKLGMQYNLYHYLINYILCVCDKNLLVENISEKSNCRCTIDKLIKKLIDEININVRYS